MEQKNKTKAELVAKIKQKHLQEYDNLIKDIIKARNFVADMDNIGYSDYIMRSRYFLDKNHFIQKYLDLRKAQEHYEKQLADDLYARQKQLEESE